MILHAKVIIVKVCNVKVLLLYSCVLTLRFLAKPVKSMGRLCHLFAALIFRWYFKNGSLNGAFKWPHQPLFFLLLLFLRKYQSVRDILMGLVS